MLVQSATSSNFQPRAPLGSRRQSPPRPPRVGARGGPVCRGQVRGSCPPGATRPSTRGRCRRGESRGRSSAIGRWLARGSAILWRSLDEQSVVPGRWRATHPFDTRRPRFWPSCHAVRASSSLPRQPTLLRVARGSRQIQCVSREVSNPEHLSSLFSLSLSIFRSVTSVLSVSAVPLYSVVGLREYQCARMCDQWISPRVLASVFDCWRRTVTGNPPAPLRIS